jgi:acetyl esterase/lipase
MNLTMEGAGTPDTLTGATKATRPAPAACGGPATRPPRRSRRRLRVLVFLVAALVVLLVRPASHHARAAALLVSFSDTEGKPKVREERLTLDVPGAPARTVPARLYRPVADNDAPGVVLVHGVHRLGIEEPRLERFARSLADAGVVVLTPEVSELSDYHVSPRSIDTAGASVEALRARLGHPKVGLMGMSFGGGIAMLAAADERFAKDVAFVVAVGAHDDLERVSRFFATDAIPEPSGGMKKLQAHSYGAAVLVYDHVEDFFPLEDVPAARDAIRLWLWEKQDEARVAAKALSPASKEKMDKLFGPSAAAMRDELLVEIDKRKAGMPAVSPHGRLAGLRSNVYLLHGEGDTVIPATETLWLAKDVPPERLRAVLVSPAIVHVELKGPSAMDKWALVHFMGQIIAEAESTR